MPGLGDARVDLCRGGRARLLQRQGLLQHLRGDDVQREEQDGRQLAAQVGVINQSMNQL